MPLPGQSRGRRVRRGSGVALACNEPQGGHEDPAVAAAIAAVNARKNRHKTTIMREATSHIIHDLHTRAYHENKQRQTQVHMIRDTVLRNHNVLAGNKKGIRKRRTSLSSMVLPTSDGNHSAAEAKAEAICSKSHASLQAQEATREWYILPLHSPAVHAWEIYVLSLVLYNAAVLPYEVAFLKDEVPSAIAVMDSVADYSFMADFALNFLKAFENERGDVETNPKEIRRQYFKFWIWIDLPACIPFEAFVPTGANNSNTEETLRYIGFVKCIRLLRIGRLLKYLEKFEYANLWNIIRLVAAFGLLAHWVGCLWYMIVTIDMDPDTNEALESRRLVTEAFGNSEVIESLDSWFDVNVPKEEGEVDFKITVYLVMLYSALCMLLGENASPLMKSQFIIHAMTLVLGALMQSYIFGQVAHLLADQNTTIGQWKFKLLIQNSTMRGLELPSDLQHRIQNYYDYYCEALFSRFCFSRINIPRHLRSSPCFTTAFGGPFV
jgi:hypothetical protein